MKRLLVLLALAGAGAVFACADDGETPEMNANDAGSGTPDAAAQDSATPIDSAVVRTVKVENPGAACTIDSECMGPEATCEVTLGEGDEATELEGGYCTATCEASEECSAGGACPFAEISEAFAFPGLNIADFLPIPSYCLDKCDSKDAADCRTGYECKSIRDVLPEDIRRQFGFVFTAPAWRTTYCMPPIDFEGPEPEPDAGAPDAGTTNAALIGGLDSGL